MKIEEYLENLKTDYEKTSATRHLRMSGWEELRARIGLLEPEYKNVWWKKYALAFALIVLFIGGLVGSYKIALASMPGDAFYPVKILSEKVIQNTTGDNQIVIDHRADEIIGLSKKEEIDREELKSVVIEYKTWVEETKKEIETSGEKNPEFQKKLEDNHRRFDEVSRENPDVQDEIKDAQDVSDHGGSED